MIKLRAHHGMCLFFFQGKGYSDDFIKNMAEKKEILSANPLVRLVDKADDICRACPNNYMGICGSYEKVNMYDAAVLELCGLDAGHELPFLEFQELVREKILEPQKRPQICGGCEWNDLCRYSPRT